MFNFLLTLNNIIDNSINVVIITNTTVYYNPFTAVAFSSPFHCFLYYQVSAFTHTHIQIWTSVSLSLPNSIMATKDDDLLSSLSRPYFVFLPSCQEMNLFLDFLSEEDICSHCPSIMAIKWKVITFRSQSSSSLTEILKCQSSSSFSVYLHICISAYLVCSCSYLFTLLL